MKTFNDLEYHGLPERARWLARLLILLPVLTLLVSCSAPATSNSSQTVTSTSATGQTTGPTTSPTTATAEQTTATTAEQTTATAEQTTAATAEQTTAGTTAAPTTSATSETTAQAVAYHIEEAFPGLSFNKPLLLTHAGDGSNRIFVVEKTGKVKVFANDPQVRTARVFIDLSNLIDSRSSEKGLLGLAFDPDYPANGFFYVNYTNQTSTVIARYQVDPLNPDQGLKGSARIILTFRQPYANHNGGHLAFGPDGYLYIATGDGGSRGDPQKNGQNRASLLGKILRIDVRHTSKDVTYEIPADNPFAGNTAGYREEIYAYGLRNPWRFSFDLERSWLWVADVGQDLVEEIDLVEKGGNYGWNIMEGNQCYPETSNCNTAGLSLPVWQYKHPTGESITGGHAYYGSKTPSLRGAYIYGDFITGIIWALRLDKDLQADNRKLLASGLQISSFGLDQANELYIVDYTGKICRLAEKAPE